MEEMQDRLRLAVSLRLQDRFARPDGNLWNLRNLWLSPNPEFAWSAGERKTRMRTEVRLAGTGGQGLILAGVVLAEACGVYEKKQVVQTQSYGPEARGGASKSDVIISDEEILYPKTRRLNVLACLSQDSANAYVKDLMPGGLLITDSTFVHSCSREDAVCVPLTQATRDRFGRDIFTNIVLLGAIASVTGAVSLDSLEKAVKNRVPPTTLEDNVTALKLGFDLGQAAGAASKK